MSGHKHYAVTNYLKSTTIHDLNSELPSLPALLRLLAAIQIPEHN